MILILRNHAPDVSINKATIIGIATWIFFYKKSIRINGLDSKWKAKYSPQPLHGFACLRAAHPGLSMQEMNWQMGQYQYGGILRWLIMSFGQKFSAVVWKSLICAICHRFIFITSHGRWRLGQFIHGISFTKGIIGSLNASLKSLTKSFLCFYFFCFFT